SDVCSSDLRGRKKRKRKKRKRAKSRAPDRVPAGPGSPIGRNSARPIPAERIRYSWEVKECAAMGLGEVAGGEWRVTSLRKKQVPRSADSSGTQKARCARNDNSRG